MNIAAAAAPAVQTWTPAPQPPRPRHLHLVPPPTDNGPDSKWIERLTQSVVEVLAGDRSATTLVASLSPVVFQALRNPSRDATLRGGKVLNVRTQALGEDSIEVAAVVTCKNGRARAVALRLALRHERWRCVCVAVL